MKNASNLGGRYQHVFRVAQPLISTTPDTNCSFLTTEGATTSEKMAKIFLKYLKKKSDGTKTDRRGRECTVEVQKYQNSYHLGSHNPFNVELVDKIVKRVMTNFLEDASYDHKECPKLCSEISAEIRKRIRKLEFDRYKIVILVTIIEKASQSLETMSGFIWDAQRDDYSTYTFETQTFHAYCGVFGIYYE